MQTNIFGFIGIVVVDMILIRYPIYSGFLEYDYTMYRVFNSHDAVSLFTNVPIDETLAIIKDRLEADNILNQCTKLNVNDLMEILKFFCTTTYFVFRGQIYRQRFGIGMGNPVSAIIAEFCIIFFRIKSRCNSTHGLSS